MRFVVHKHTLDSEKYHYDLMFEDGDVLKTYQIENIDDLLNLQEVQGRNIQDHRLIYLDYEGEISHNRGFVKIFDKGEYVVKAKSNNSMEFEVKGSVLKGIMLFSLLDNNTKVWKLTYNVKY